MAPDEGPLNIADAVAHLDAPPEKVEEQQAAQVETTETEEVPTSEDADGPETATEGDSDETEGETEGDEPEQTPLEPPKFWDAKAKERFGELPRDLQEIVLEKEVERDKVTAKTIEAGTLKTKALEAAESKYMQYAAGLDKLLPEAESAFKARWPDDIDWNKVAEEQGADAAFKLKNQYETEKTLVQRLETAKNEANQVLTQRFIDDRNEKFKTVIPEFSDPKTGPDEQLKVVKYLTGLGINPDIIIKKASAEELSIARKAMLWDNAQAKTAALANKKPAAPASTTQVRPTAPTNQGNSQTASLKAARKAFESNPSLKNAEALARLTG